MKEMCPRSGKQNILGWVGAAALKSPLPNHLYLDHDYTSHDYTNHASLNHNLITPKCELIEAILEGSFYEIDHSQLPPKRTPAVLHSVRAVMVTTKTEQNVTVRYPSTQSLEDYFGNVDDMAEFPNLDGKYIMGPKLVVKVLKRHIPSREFEELRHLKSFWLVGYGERKHGQCFSKLQGSIIKGWGSQVKVSYRPVSNELNDVLEKVESPGEGDKSVKEEECHETKANKIIQYSRKRKRGRPPSSQSKKSKNSRLISKQKAIEVKAEFEGNTNKDYADRWPIKRYEAAARELVEVLKANGGVHGNPISRSQLRTEARKRIGDTGLLDHLLKHLAGKVVPPDGKDRLRRRCDADGMMEYWLENAELANIRKEAGVKDPYWIPPPGWKLGDSISLPDCMCRKEIKKLKEELSIMRSQVAELQTRDKNVQPNTLVMPDSAQSIGRVRVGNMNGKESYETLLKKKFLMEEQLFQISKALKDMEQEGMNVQPSKAEAAGRLQLMPPQSSPAEEMNEDSEEEAAIGDLSEGHDADAENRSQPKKLIVKLKPCRCPDNISNTQISQEGNRSVKDFMARTTASGSPLSTTTS